MKRVDQEPKQPWLREDGLQSYFEASEASNNPLADSSSDAGVAGKDEDEVDLIDGYVSDQFILPHGGALEAHQGYSVNIYEQLIPMFQHDYMDQGNTFGHSMSEKLHPKHQMIADGGAGEGVAEDNDLVHAHQHGNVGDCCEAYFDTKSNESEGMNQGDIDANEVTKAAVWVDMMEEDYIDGPREEVHLRARSAATTEDSCLHYQQVTPSHLDERGFDMSFGPPWQNQDMTDWFHGLY